MDGKKNVYPEVIKREVIRLKLTGEYTNRQQMERFELNINHRLKLGGVFSRGQGSIIQRKLK